MARNELPLETVILSAERADASPSDNAHRTLFLERHLQRSAFNYSQAEGMYKGTKEVSFVVTFHARDSDIKREVLAKIARAFQQESILHITADRTATLVYVGRDDARPPVELGKFARVSAAEAANLDAYTLLGGEFYAVN